MWLLTSCLSSCIDTYVSRRYQEWSGFRLWKFSSVPKKWFGWQNKSQFRRRWSQSWRAGGGRWAGNLYFYWQFKTLKIDSTENILAEVMHSGKFKLFPRVFLLHSKKTVDIWSDVNFCDRMQRTRGHVLVSYEAMSSVRCHQCQDQRTEVMGSEVIQNDNVNIISLYLVIIIISFCTHNVIYE